MDEIEFLGQVISISNDKIRLNILTAKSFKAEVEKSKATESKVTFFHSVFSNIFTKIKLYDRLFLVYGDCLAAIRDDIKEKGSEKGEKFIANMRLLHTFISYQLLLSTIDRNLLMASQLVERLNAPSSKQKPVSPSNIVKIYENLIQNVTDIQGLPGIDENISIMNEMKAKEEMFTAFKCFYLGKSFAVAKQWKKAFALYERSEQLAGIARHKIENVKLSSKELTDLITLIQKEKITTRAQSVLDSTNSSETIQVMYLLKISTKLLLAKC
jgi:signal recognition particle subunit SRP68